MIMAELVRVAASLTGYFDVAGQLGADPRPHLRAAGLSRAMLLSPEQVIPARAAIALLETSAAASGCPTFALRIAACRSLADLGMISLLIAHQPTLRDALDILARFRHRINSILVLRSSRTWRLCDRPRGVVARHRSIRARQRTSRSVFLPNVRVASSARTGVRKASASPIPAPALEHRDMPSWMRGWTCSRPPSLRWATEDTEGNSHRGTEGTEESISGAATEAQRAQRRPDSAVTKRSTRCPETAHPWTARR